MPHPAIELAQLLQQPAPSVQLPTALTGGSADPYADLAAKAKARWPRLAKYPIQTISSGPPIPTGSETYPPTEDRNPHPGHWTIQLNPKKMTGDPVSNVGLEMIHTLQGEDPQYQKFTDQFIQSMTPDQRKSTQRLYAKEKTAGEHRPYDQWLKTVQAQEYIRGGIFTDVIPNWVGPKGEGGYTPQQAKLLDQIKQYLQTDK